MPPPDMREAVIATAYARRFDLFATPVYTLFSLIATRKRQEEGVAWSCHLMNRCCLARMVSIARARHAPVAGERAAQQDRRHQTHPEMLTCRAMFYHMVEMVAMAMKNEGREVAAYAEAPFRGSREG